MTNGRDFARNAKVLGFRLRFWLLFFKEVE